LFDVPQVKVMAEETINDLAATAAPHFAGSAPRTAIREATAIVRSDEPIRIGQDHLASKSAIPEAAGFRRAGRSPRYWRSLEELARDEAGLIRLGDEFAPDADVWLDPLSRRNFLTIMGASLALAGLVGCDDFPDEKIVPYVNQPESVVPGKPSFYATTIPMNGYGIGALAESHEGRPTKIEGNPDHPASLGATNVFMQASVLDLYDPDRSKVITHGGNASSWGAFQVELSKYLDGERGKGDGLRILTRCITSPTFAEQLGDLKRQFPGLRWHLHDPTETAGCSGRAPGAPAQRAVYDFSKADVILSLDADFVINDVGSLAYARQFADGRRRQPGVVADRQTMNRLYVIENALTLTGSMADHRRAVMPSEILPIARAIAAKLGVDSAHGSTAPAAMEKFIDAVAADLKNPKERGPSPRNGGVGLVVAGDHQPPELQALALAMNRALGSVGKAVKYIDPPDVQGADSLQTLIADMGAGKVRALLIFGGNPVYDAPADVPFKEALQRLTTMTDGSGKADHLTVHLSQHEDETSFLCQWHIPESHYLEAWGDLRAYDGSASLIQPLIVPMSPASRSIWEIMEALAGRPDQSVYEAVRATWQRQWAVGHPTAATQPSTQPSNRGNPPPKTQRDARTFDEWWQLALQKGVIDESAFAGRDIDKETDHSYSAAAVAARSSNQDTGGRSVPRSRGEWEIAFRPDPAVWDGQYANNSWLQELPKPFTKLVWDNAAHISYRSAEKLSISDGSMVRITIDKRTLNVPVVIVPGMADQTMVLTLGYGRTRAGRVAETEDGAARGFNAYLLRTSKTGGFGAGSVEVVGGATSWLVMTRSHHAMSDLPGYDKPKESGRLAPHSIEHPGMPEDKIEILNRKLVRSATLDDFRHDEDWVTRLGGETEMRAKGLSADFPGRRIQLSIYPANAADGGWDYAKGFQWGMSIDQNTCIGCNACVIACQAENNIPVVGKEQVSRQREMHWIRIDDWFGSQPGEADSNAVDEPQVVHMAVPCQHCENAPCEVVCPVGATTHSVEGLNEMTYNRCIGTRYCSNNCPYKVRRFNFLLFSDYSSPTRALQFNPDVTVRSRGVMEKCTFCVQRLNRTRMEIEKLTVQLEERAKVLESESPEKAAALRNALPSRQKKLLDQLQTACQQACPTQAIVFGDKNDPQSHVAKLKADKLDYTLLADLTTVPRTSYMARLRNPNSAI
jgi:molybdopterin-containing oxidoreductase family iron-sulfur binding subunit